ncbi:hypothetical protein NQ317_014490 [Molorchus minor]|uniref:tRNA/rRNA methyltransferase SpoU type domain-containing protein n=1 Tax=Molorchus minor TaxID=1323400 RepID=A0ABQ9IZQ4_9CUCU|nr:hypothetical protein NQ317_014490 [Molorchus minor]
MCFKSLLESDLYYLGKIHLIKLRIIQLLLTIHPFIKTAQQTLIDLIMESFCVEIHQPCIRQLMQWLLFLLIKHEPDALSLIAIKIKNSSKTQPSSIAAFTMVLLFLTMSQPESFWMSTVELLLPWCMGPNFKLRVYAQMAIKSLYEEAMQRSYKEFLFKYSFLEKSIHFIIGASGQSFHDTLKSDELFFNKFNPERDYSLQTIFVDIPKLNNVTETEWENMVSNKFTSFEHIPILSENKIFAVMIIYKKKITPWKVILEEEQDNQWLDFILIASLIDKPTNLGGLARTCEVFGIKQLVLNNEKVVNDKVFKGLSMSSENWIEIIEVKGKGYCVLGAEQTSESISLNSYRFKKRTALLLGPTRNDKSSDFVTFNLSVREQKEGIPPDIIPMLDACVGNTSIWCSTFFKCTCCRSYLHMGIC